MPPSNTTATPINMGDTTTNYNPVTQYICGECAAKVQLSRGMAIRCGECGHRILYKERTKRYLETCDCVSYRLTLTRMVQFEAR